MEEKSKPHSRVQENKQLGRAVWRISPQVIGSFAEPVYCME